MKISKKTFWDWLTHSKDKFLTSNIISQIILKIRLKWKFSEFSIFLWEIHPLVNSKLDSTSSIFLKKTLNLSQPLSSPLPNCKNRDNTLDCRKPWTCLTLWPLTMRNSRGSSRAHWPDWMRLRGRRCVHWSMWASGLCRSSLKSRTTSIRDIASLIRHARMRKKWLCKMLLIWYLRLVERSTSKKMKVLQDYTLKNNN
jgi:hypothetical protein